MSCCHCVFRHGPLPGVVEESNDWVMPQPGTMDVCDILVT